MAKPDPTEALARVERAAKSVIRARRALRAAEPEWHAAIVAAVDALESAKEPGAFQRVADAAGSSRQQVRQLVERNRDAEPAPRRTKRAR